MNQKHIFKKGDFLLVGAVLLFSCFLYALFSFRNSTPAAYAEISVDGETVTTLDLNQDTALTVTGYQGGTNTVTVSHQAVSVTEASCPDLVCVHTGQIHNTGETIVCLPNRVVVTIVQGTD